MNDTNTFFHNDDNSIPQGAELDALRAQYDASVAGRTSTSGATSRAPGVDARVQGGSYAYDASTGNVTNSSVTAGSTHYQESIPEGHIRIGDQIVGIESAILAGLIDPSILPMAPKTGDKIDGLRYQALAQKAADAAYGAPKAQQQTQQNNNNSPANNADAALATINAAYNGLAQTLGDTGIEAVELAVIQNGGLPDDFRANGGKSVADAERVIAGFVSATDKTLSSYGVSCEGLPELLTDDELYAARKAAFYGNNDALEAIGREARNRLAGLPDADPATFTGLLQGHPAASRVGRDNSGNVTITLDSGQVITWGAAVQAGIVRI